MKNVRKKLALLTAFAIIASTSLFGCKSDKKADNNPDVKETTKQEERIKLKMFMSDSNLPYPDGVNPSDNPFINIVENYANVDLELEVPSYADFTTKLNLLLASSNIPDIVHTNSLKPVLEAADAGMFIDIKKYYDSSVNVKKYITPQMMELTKTPSGKYLRIPMAGMPEGVPQGGGIKVMYNILKQYNSGKYPATIDEWLALFKKVKDADPEMNIIIPNKDAMSNGGAFPFYMNGVRYPDEIKYMKGGKAVYFFETPEFRTGLELYKKLYDEGYVFKEFLTLTPADRTAKHNKGKIMIGWGASTEIIAADAKFATDPTTKGAFQTMVAPIIPKGADPMYSYPTKQGLIHPQHSLFISSQTKNPERAFRVIEGLADPKFIDSVAWGKEGQEYTIKDGKRDPIPDKINDKNRAWARSLSLVASMQINYQVTSATLAQSFSAEDYKAIVDSQNLLNGYAEKKGNLFSDSDVGYVNDPTKDTEARTFISETIIKVIMGQQPITWYDQRVTEFKQKYGKLAQDRADYYYKNRAELEKKGFVFWWEK